MVLAKFARTTCLPCFNISSFPVNKKLCRGGTWQHRSEHSHSIAMLWSDREAGGPSLQGQSQAEAAVGGAGPRGGHGVAVSALLRQVAANGRTAAGGKQTTEVPTWEQHGECFYKGKVTAQLTAAVGVDKGSKSREHKIKKDKDIGGKKDEKRPWHIWKEKHKRTCKCVWEEDRKGEQKTWGNGRRNIILTNCKWNMGANENLQSRCHSV